MAAKLLCIIAILSALFAVTVAHQQTCLPQLSVVRKVHVTFGAGFTICASGATISAQNNVLHKIIDQLFVQGDTIPTNCTAFLNTSTICGEEGSTRDSTNTNTNTNTNTITNTITNTNTNTNSNSNSNSRRRRATAGGTFGFHVYIVCGSPCTLPTSNNSIKYQLQLRVMGQTFKDFFHSRQFKKPTYPNPITLQLSNQSVSVSSHIYDRNKYYYHYCQVPAPSNDENTATQSDGKGPQICGCPSNCPGMEGMTGPEETTVPEVTANVNAA